MIETIDRAALVRRARYILECRRKRASFIDSVIFGEAAWDMLLDLYIREREDSQADPEALFDFTGTSASVPRRWMNCLLSLDLVVLDPNPALGTSTAVRLTRAGTTAIEAYLSCTLAIPS